MSECDKLYQDDRC